MPASIEHNLAPRLARSSAVFAADPVALSFECVSRSHPGRSGLEAFVADSFFRHYGAHVHHFHDVLIGCKDDSGEWVAAVGYTSLTRQSAFLEQYLDLPIDQAIQSKLALTDAALTVGRRDLVEVGNLASTRAGASRAIILYMTRYLYQQRFRWVVLTATRELSNSFRRLGYGPVALGLADPQRIQHADKLWGSYYDSEPQVMFVDIGASYAKISA